MTILKYYPSSSYAMNTDRVGAFLLEHGRHCHPRWFAGDLGRTSGFVIVTEEGESALDVIAARHGVVDPWGRNGGAPRETRAVEATE